MGWSMFCTIISDCRDDNASARQATRVASLFGSDINAMTMIGVSTELEAAGNLVDVLDATDGTKGIVLVNVAPRVEGELTGCLNGAPFGCFSVGETMVISTGTGYTLSLMEKLGMVKDVDVFDIPTVTQWAVEQGLIMNKNVADDIVHSQFRSFEFVPRLAWWIYQHKNPPAQLMDISGQIKKPPFAVWWVDCFGNCKTTLLPGDLRKMLRLYPESMPPWGKLPESPFLDLPIYEHLYEVPTETPAWVNGSSGFNTARFLELVVKGGSAAEQLGLASGSQLFPSFTPWM